MTNSYPQPTTLPSYPTIHPRSLRPLETPPVSLVQTQYPSLPPSTRQPSFADTFTLSTHVVPAAYPRSTPHVPLPASPSDELNRQERRKYLSEQTQELMKLKTTYDNGELSLLPVSTKLHWSVINRYVRKSVTHSGAGGGLTLFFAHANGFPKEIWEPVIAHLLETPGGAHISEIWAIDAVQHGDGALLNADSLGALFDWSDHARDILNFLLYYLPSDIADPGTPLPTNLERLPESVVEARRKNGFSSRRFIAVGHSYGGTSSTLAALTVPAPFDSLFLVDPQIHMPPTYMGGRTVMENFVLGALARRDTWSSKEEALKMYSRTPFFQAWDPAALRIYVETGTFDSPNSSDTGTITRLKQPGLFEGITFTEARVMQEVWQRLPTLDPRIELRWVFPGEDKQPFGEEGCKAAQVRAWRRPARASNVKIAGAGHLIAQEKPKSLAQDLSAFIIRKVGQSRL